MSLGLLSDSGRSVLLHAQSSADSIDVQAVLVLLLLLDLVSSVLGLIALLGPMGPFLQGLRQPFFSLGLICLSTCFV
jgi:hypothetical protein